MSISRDGFTVGYDRNGLASIGSVERAQTHVDSGAWVTCEGRGMTYDEAKAICDDVNAGVRTARAAEARCETCGGPARAGGSTTVAAGVEAMLDDFMGAHA